VLDETLQIRAHADVNVRERSRVKLSRHGLIVKMFALKLHENWEDLLDLAPHWDRILRSCSQGIRGPDATCSAVWARALGATLLKDSALQVLVVSSKSEPVAIIPSYRGPRAAFPLARRELRLITAAYCGRGGLLVSDDDPELAQFTLQQLQKHIPAWDVFIFDTVEGSGSHAAVVRAAHRLSWPLRCVAAADSPFIELAPQWQTMLAALPKKTRWTIRKCERELSAQGRLEYSEVTGAAAVPALMQTIYEIERNSWKERSRTSITAHASQQRFYEVFADLAAHHAMLSAHVLRIDDRPLAYILGITAGDGTFLDLKESFDASYAEFSPGHVLKRFAMEALIAHGVTIYDFMGACEPYKLRWTDRRYRRLRIALYNRSLRSSLHYARSALGARVAAMRRTRDGATASPDTTDHS
jgi:CelD/BcsL family acetyltransferase involved in cellulose biosynthesis